MGGREELGEGSGGMVERWEIEIEEGRQGKRGER